MADVSITIIPGREIEPGYYEFRATGIDKQGEMQVINSYPKKANSRQELKEQQAEFITECKEGRGVDSPKVTHTIMKDKDYINYAEYWD